MTLGLPINGTFDECIADVLAGNLNAVPGVSFNYGSSHMQVAGAMAVAAGHYSDWQALLTASKTTTGLFAFSTYNKPRPRNPRLAGDMAWHGRECPSLTTCDEHPYPPGQVRRSLAQGKSPPQTSAAR